MKEKASIEVVEVFFFEYSKSRDNYFLPEYTSKVGGWAPK